MVELIAAAAQVALIALIGYNLATAAFGWPNPSPAVPGGRHRRFRIVVPAHDEEAVIGMLQLNRGNFSFLAKIEAGEKTMETTLTRILLEASRREDEGE